MDGKDNLPSKDSGLNQTNESGDNVFRDKYVIQRQINIFGDYIENQYQSGNKQILSQEVNTLVFEKTTSFSAKEILGVRANMNFFEDFYFKRTNIDNKIEILLNDKYSLLFTGKALVGKSRTVFQCLTKFQSFNDCVIFLARREEIIVNEKDSIDFRFKLIDRLITTIKQANSNGITSFFVFNDLDTFLNAEGIALVIEKILSSENTILLATCRNFEYLNVEEQLGHIIHSAGLKVKRIDIPVLTNDKEIFKEEFTKNTNLDIDHSEVDDTIGSYFLNLNEMRKYYSNFSHKSLEKEILWGLKINHFFKKKNKGKLKYIKEYIYLRFLNFYNEKINWTKENWKDSLLHLKNLDFLGEEKDADGEKILKIDETYLDRIIVSKYLPNISPDNNSNSIDPNYFKENELAEDIISCYSNYKPIEPALEGNDFNKHKLFNILLARTQSDQLRMQLFMRMKNEGLIPDEITMNILIWHSKTIDKAESYYEKIIELGNPLSSYTLNFITSKYPTFDQAYQRYRKFIELGVKPDEYTLRVFLTKTDDFFAIWEFYKEFRELVQEKVQSPFIFYNMLGKAKSFPQGYQLYHEMISLGIKPNQSFFESLIRKKGGEIDDVLKIYSELQKIDESDIESYTIVSLINKVPDFKTAEEIFNSARKSKIIRKTPAFYTCMVKKSPAYSIARKFFDQMASDGITPTTNAFNALISKANDLEGVIQLYEEMNEEEIPTDPVTYYFLVKKIQEFSTGVRFPT